MSITVSVDAKATLNHASHWLQFVPKMSTDIRGHLALRHHHQASFTQLLSSETKTVSFQWYFTVHRDEAPEL